MRKRILNRIVERSSWHGRRIAFTRAVPFILSRRRLQWLSSGLFRLALSGMNIETWRPDQRDERLFLRRLRARLPPSPVVFDAGANAGQFLTLLREEWPSARVVSFEPNPTIFPALAEVAAESGAAAENLALGADAGSALLFDKASEPGSQHATIVAGVMEDIYAAETDHIAVTVETVDRYAAARDISYIDLLKIDVEGFELEVIRGAAALIAAGRIGVLQIEFNTMNILSRVFMRDIIQALPGYRIHRILGNGDLQPLDGLPITQRELFGYQNIVALAPGLAR